jgi:sialate O-acetylesterase
MKLRTGLASLLAVVLTIGAGLAHAEVKGVKVLHAASLPKATLPTELKLPTVISSHMVLQRELAVPIWGTAAPGEKVTVKFRDQEKSAVADSQGKWSLKLDPLKAGGPDVLTIAGKKTFKLDDVLVGEVWVGSGQSNMAGGVGGFAKNDEALAKLAEATYPQLRLKTGYGGWQEATPKNIAGFSAILFAFGVPLQKNLDVPVGLMLGAAGGTPSGRWLSQAALDADAPCQELIKKVAATYSPEAEQKKFEQAVAQWEKDFAVAKAKADKDLAEAKVKGEKEFAEAKKAVRLPRKPDLPAKPGECERGAKVGDLYEAHIRQFIPFGIRGVLWDQGESGTALQGVDQYTLMGALIRGWRNEWGQGEFAFLYVQKPSGGGCAWDPADPVTCKAEKFVPLPAKTPALWDGTYRETHIRILKYPNTAMVTATDLGSGTHPVNKAGYGARAARVALGLVYGKPLEIYGPLYESHQIEGSKVRVKFTHVGQGLSARHSEKLQGFAIAGDDKVFHWADAVIDGDAVVLSSAAVSKPAAVRYAWGGNHPWANLFNKDGLPALTFRTDAW